MKSKKCSKGNKRCGKICIKKKYKCSKKKSMRRSKKRSMRRSVRRSRRRSGPKCTPGKSKKCGKTCIPSKNKCKKRRSRMKKSAKRSYRRSKRRSKRRSPRRTYTRRVNPVFGPVNTSIRGNLLYPEEKSELEKMAEADLAGGYLNFANDYRYNPIKSGIKRMERGTLSGMNRFNRRFDI